MRVQPLTTPESFGTVTEVKTNTLDPRGGKGEGSRKKTSTGVQTRGTRSLKTEVGGKSLPR